MQLSPTPDPLLMPDWSRYGGQPIDARTRCSIKMLESGYDDSFVVDYFFHHGKYWRALIPRDGVKDIYGQTFNFSKILTRQSKNGVEIIYDRRGQPKRLLPMLKHVQSRFHFHKSTPVNLYPLHQEIHGEPEYQLFDITYSLEAVGPVGVFFSFRDGMLGNLICAHRFLSTQEMVFERLVVENQYIVEAAALPIKDSVKSKVLQASLLRSHQAGMTEPYHLFHPWGTNNCASTPFQILDQVMDYHWTRRLAAMLYRLPLNPRLYLRLRGLDADPQYRNYLRVEFEEYINAEETQERKRKYVREMNQIRRMALISSSGSESHSNANE